MVIGSRAGLAGIVALVLSACFGSPGADASTVFGANTMQLASNYHGKGSNKSGSAAETWAGTMLGRKAIADANDMGFQFVRMAVGGYGPSTVHDVGVPFRDDMSAFMIDSDDYWAQLDKLFDDLDASNIRVVPVLMWNPAQFPSMTGETVSKMLKGPSQSRLLAKAYIQAFFKHYAKRKTILFVELMNEWNLEADIPANAWCRAGTDPRWAVTLCAAIDNFTTADLASFTSDMIRFVHANAPGVLVSPGFSMPRPGATAMMKAPLWVDPSSYFRSDTKDEMFSMLELINKNADVLSIHVYPGDGRQGQTEAQTVSDIADYTHRQLHKKLFVGEFGDVGAGAYFTSMLTQMRASDVDFASVWAWEFMGPKTWQPSTGINVDPSVATGVIGLLAATLGTTDAVAAAPPRTLLVAPMPCSQLPVGRPTILGAVASGVGKVEFYIDGASVGSSVTAPYQTSVFLDLGVHTVSAVGSIGSLTAVSTYQVTAGLPPSGCRVPVLTTFPNPKARLTTTAAVVSGGVVLSALAESPPVSLAFRNKLFVSKNTHQGINPATGASLAGEVAGHPESYAAYALLTTAQPAPSSVRRKGCWQPNNLGLTGCGRYSPLAEDAAQ